MNELITGEIKYVLKEVREGRKPLPMSTKFSIPSDEIAKSLLEEVASGKSKFTVDDLSVFCKARGVGDSIIMEAVSCGSRRLEIVANLIDAKAADVNFMNNPDSVYDDTLNPLAAAVINRDLEMIKLLLDKGANPNDLVMISYNTLFGEMSHFHTILECLISDDDKANYNKEIIDLLVSGGATLNGRENLVYSASSISVLESFITKYNADVNAPLTIPHLSHPLVELSCDDETKAVATKLLIDHGANPNVVIEPQFISHWDEVTPLSLSGPLTTEVLLKNGARLRNESEVWWTEILNIAKNTPPLEVAFLKEHIHPNAPDQNTGRTQLHAIAEYGDGEKEMDSAMKLLGSLANPLAVDIQDKEGKTPLMVAALSGNEYMIELLKEMGANPTLVDQNGKNVVQLLEEDTSRRQKKPSATDKKAIILISHLKEDIEAWNSSEKPVGLQDGEVAKSQNPDRDIKK